MSVVADIQKQVHSMQWVHQIDLGNGLVTPGRWPPHPLILQAFDSVNFRGKRVLDIGCWDGLWSFEAERRGAKEVFATDDISQRCYQGQGTFELAHRVLGSRVQYNPHVSVYDVANSGISDCDIVIFCGIYYHLRHPLKAFAQLRRVCSDGAIIIVEGPAIYDEEEAFAQFYYREQYCNDPSNWWVPTIPCLQQWLECSYFDMTQEFRGGEPSTWWQRMKRQVKAAAGRRPHVMYRYACTARAVRRRDSNYLYPDEDLHPFELNGCD